MKPNWRRRAAPQAERDRREVRRIAWHEAAHAAMNLILGVNVECIVIGRGLIDDDDMRLRGRCEWKTTTGEGIPLDVLLRTSIAGLIADELYFSREWDLDSADYREALASAEEVAEATGADVGAVMASARADVEALIQRNTAAIAVLADALLGARWMTLPGVQVAHILERSGVQRAQAPGATRAQLPDVSSHRRGPQRDATSFGFERRRGGLTLPSANAARHGRF